MGDLASKLGGVIVVIAVVLGLKVYNKGQDATEVRATFVEICDGEQACIDGVEAHFETCFDSSYSMGGRRRSATLDGERFASCLNEKSGSEWFSFDGSSD